MVSQLQPVVSWLLHKQCDRARDMLAGLGIHTLDSMDVMQVECASFEATLPAESAVLFIAVAMRVIAQLATKETTSNAAVQASSRQSEDNANEDRLVVVGFADA